MTTTTTLAKSLRSDRVMRLRLRSPVTAAPEASIDEVVRRMAQSRSGYMLIQDAGRLVGIFTERDFVNRVVAAGRDVSGPVREVMTPNPTTLTHRDNVQKAVEVMGTGGYRHMPVLGDDGQPVGVLAVRDIIHYLVEYFPAKVYNLPPTPEHAQPAREGA
jgi:CBS domain-containing protein